MILKEFDLDLPYIKEDAEDYEQSWKPKRLQFRNECRCIASMTERYFKNYRYKTPFSWKLMIECYSEINKSRKSLLNLKYTRLIWSLIFLDISIWHQKKRNG